MTRAPHLVVKTCNIEPSVGRTRLKRLCNYARDMRHKYFPNKNIFPSLFFIVYFVLHACLTHTYTHERSVALSILHGLWILLQIFLLVGHFPPLKSPQKLTRSCGDFEMIFAYSSHYSVAKTKQQTEKKTFISLPSASEIHR